MIPPVTWQQKLVEQHPTLFIRHFRGIPFSPGYPFCREGWQDLVSRLVARVASAADGYPVYFTQIREQHGHLEAYWRADVEFPLRVELAIAHAVALAEARSNCTCCFCGEKGRLFSTGSLLMTVCAEHAEGVPVLPGIHDIFLIRTEVGGKPVIGRRSYDRATDTFVDAK